MDKIITRVMFLLACIPWNTISQTFLRGMVSDARTAMPLPGVNILIKGTTSGTVTDFDGKFNLSGVNMNDTILFSFLGFQTKEIVFSGQSDLAVALIEDTSVLDEIVVIGYGLAKKARHYGFCLIDHF